MRTGRQAPLRLNEASSTPRTIFRVVVGAALCGLVACVEMPIDPPQLDLQLPPPPVVDPLARDPNAPVVVKNGKGEVLAQGLPDRQGNFSSNPSLGAFDGTLVIETKRNDGSTDVQRVTYPAGQPVKLRREDATGRYVAEAPEKQFLRPHAVAEFGFLNLDRPDASLFRRENGGVIRGAAIEQDNRDEGHSAKIGVEFPLNFGNYFSSKTRAYFGLRAGYVDSTASSWIPELRANGDQFGIFTPGNGVTTGQDLRDIAYTSEYEERFGGFDLRKIYQVYGPLYLNSSVGLTYGRQSVDERLSLRTSITNTRVDHVQDTSSRYFGVPLSTAMWTNPFPSYQDFWLTFGGTLEPRHHSGEADWRVSSNAFADRTQTLKDEGWTLGGGVHVGGYFGDPLNLGRQGFPITVGLKSGVRWDAYPQVEYTDLNAGDGGATLKHKTGQSAFGLLQVQLRF